MSYIFSVMIKPATNGGKCDIESWGTCVDIPIAGEENSIMRVMYHVRYYVFIIIQL